MKSKNEQTITLAIESQEGVVSETGTLGIGGQESDHMMLGTFDTRDGRVEGTTRSEVPMQPNSGLQG